MASASLFKPTSATVLDKPEWVKGQTLRQAPVFAVRFNVTAPSALTVRASSYGDELVKTAVRVFVLLFSCFYASFRILDRKI